LFFAGKKEEKEKGTFAYLLFVVVVLITLHLCVHLHAAV
jgi:hypothetical protein